MPPPDTRYAKAGDVHVAYQVVSEGPPDLVLVSTWFSHVEARWDFPGFAYYLRRLASFSRLISFDKRGIGLSILLRWRTCRCSRSGWTTCAWSWTRSAPSKRS